MGKPIKHQFQSESTQKTSYLKTSFLESKHNYLLL